MGRQGYRSQSGGSMSEMTASPSSPSPLAIKAATELFDIWSSLEKNGGKSFLHSSSSSTSNHDNDDNMGLAQALLERASQLDHVSTKGQESSVLQKLLMARDAESGYTPLHCAMMERNLARVLQILRHAAASAAIADSNDVVHRLAQRPMHLLQGDVVSTKDTLVGKLVSCRDYEGLNPLDLLCRLQRNELAQCRRAISSNATIVAQGHHEQRGGGGEQAMVENEFHVLQEASTTMFPLNSTMTICNNVGCEVLTFGRVNHVALGGLSEKHSCEVRPQRVQAFALSHLGKDHSAVAVAAASHHTLVATRHGRLYAFGLGKGGRLGTGDERHHPVPTRVMGPLARKQVVAIAAAENHSLCVTSEGSVYAWGSNRFGQLGGFDSQQKQQQCLARRVDNLPQCVSVAAGDRHSVALSNRGEVYTWGDNQAGQLGITLRNNTGSCSFLGGGGGGQQVNRVDALWGASPRRVAIAISAAAQSTLVLTSPASSLPNNSVFSWGHGNHVPIKIHFVSSADSVSSSLSSPHFLGRGHHHVNPVAISCAKYHNAAVTADGRVFTWGLHAEPLGTKAKQPKSVVLPQLVTGMLAENGGGTAVAISACENHTAVLTDCGHLYTWGATYGKDVLGHEGVRWQPSPKKVPGVYRAVGVAAAKEHTVLLVGTSFPSMSSSLSNDCPSLETLAAKSVAQHVDLFNVVPILVIAERSSCSFLIDYCQEFIRLNLDGVLTLGKKSEMDRYLNDKLADGAYHKERYEQDASYHPLLFDVIGFESKHANAWMESCKSLMDRLPISLMSRYRSTLDVKEQTPQLGRTRRVRGLSFSGENATPSSNKQDEDPSSEVIAASSTRQAGFQGCSERCMMLTANMSVNTADSAQTKHDCLSKEVRSVRKRLNQITKLEQTEGSLSSEQKEKLARRPLLETDLVVLEKALLQVEDKMHSLGLTFETKRLATPDAAPDKKVAAEEPAAESKDCVDPKEAKAADAAAGDIGELRSSFRCNICQISCPDANSFAFHKSGRKHRNRLNQAEDQDRKKTAASMMEMKRRQLIMTEPARPKPKPSPWQKKDDQSLSVKPKYKLPPPPAFPSPESKARPLPLPATKRRDSWSSPVPASSKKAVSAKKSSSFLSILKEEEARAAANAPARNRKQFQSTPEKSSSPWTLKASTQRSSPVARTPQPSPLATSSTSPLFSLGRGASDYSPTDPSSKKTHYSLGDFLVSPSAATAKQATPQVAAPWMAASPSTCSSSGVAAAAAPAPAFFLKSFAEIQQEEQDLRIRQDQSCGMDGRWFVQQRERAGSISRIQEEEAKERDHQLLVEEQMRIEEEIKREQEQKLNESKQKKKRNRKNHLQQNQRDSNNKSRNTQKDGGSSGKDTKAQDTSGGDGKRNQNERKNGNNGEGHKRQSKAGGNGKKSRSRNRNRKPKPSSDSATLKTDAAPGST